MICHTKKSGSLSPIVSLASNGITYNKLEGLTKFPTLLHAEMSGIQVAHHPDSVSSAFANEWMNLKLHGLLWDESKIQKQINYTVLYTFNSVWRAYFAQPVVYSSEDEDLEK